MPGHLRSAPKVARMADGADGAEGAQCSDDVCSAYSKPGDACGGGNACSASFTCKADKVCDGNLWCNSDKVYERAGALGQTAGN